MYFDTHCHLSLFKEISSTIAKAKAQSVNFILAVSMYYADNWKVLELANKYKEVIPALGIHPIEAANITNFEEKLDRIKRLVSENGVFTIGEIGLDRYFIKEKLLWERQETILRHFLDFAVKNELTVNLHGKDAEKQLFEVLSQYDLKIVVVHWFAGSQKLIKEGINRGYYFSITPAISYSKKMRDVVELVPLEQLLSESDGPVKYKGKSPFIGEPALMQNVITEIARIKQHDRADVEHLLYKTAERIFLRKK